MQGDEPQRANRSIDSTDHDDYFFGGYSSGVTRVEGIVRSLVQDSNLQRIIDESDELTVAQVNILLLLHDLSSTFNYLFF